jgi:hypothetical protein
MSRAWLAPFVPALLIAAAGREIPAAQHPAIAVPFDVLRNGSDWARLEQGEPVVRVLTATGRDLLVLGVTTTTAAVDQMLAASTTLDVLQKNAAHTAGARISVPPTPADFAAVVLGDRDLADLRGCQVGACDMKLSMDEIHRVQRTMRDAGPDWKAAVQRTFRGILLDRAQAYLADRHAGMAPYADKRKPIDSRAEFTAIVRQPVLARWVSPAQVDQILTARTVAPPILDSFLSWSVTSYGGKPVTAITHTVVVESAGAGHGALPIAIAAQVFATHYFTGSVAVTSLIDRGGHRYLVYLHASRLDLFDGWLGGVARRTVERRVGEAGPTALGRFRDRLEQVRPAR